MIENKELLSEEKIKMFEEDQKEYSTETALHNYMWLLLDQIFRGLGVTEITTETTSAEKKSKRSD